MMLALELAWNGGWGFGEVPRMGFLMTGLRFLGSGNWFLCRGNEFLGGERGSSCQYVVGTDNYRAGTDQEAVGTD
jgi:hypothetical protein